MTSRVHVVFAITWLVWFLNVIAAHLVFNAHPLYATIVLLAFLPIEGFALGARKPVADTLSEVVTWVVRKLSKIDATEDPNAITKGWNLLVPIIALNVSALLYRVYDHAGVPWFWLVPICAALTLMLSYHWFHPEKYG